MEAMVCFSCGTPLSNKWDAFALARAELAKSVKTGTAVDLTSLDPEYVLSLRAIFEVLCIEKYCCRTFLMTAKQFDEIGA